MVIDISGYLAGEVQAKNRTVDDFRNVCENQNFLQVVGHSVPADLQSRYLASLADFLCSLGPRKGTRGPEQIEMPPRVRPHRRPKTRRTGRGRDGGPERELLRSTGSSARPFPSGTQPVAGIPSAFQGDLHGILRLGPRALYETVQAHGSIARPGRKLL